MFYSEELFFELSVSTFSRMVSRYIFLKHVIICFLLSMMNDPRGVTLFIVVFPSLVYIYRMFELKLTFRIYIIYTPYSLLLECALG